MKIFFGTGFFSGSRNKNAHKIMSQARNRNSDQRSLFALVTKRERLFINYESILFAVSARNIGPIL